MTANPVDDLRCDVLVIGSGASGLTAAIVARRAGLSVRVVEKEPLYGGTSAISGGMLWVPCNHLQSAVGIQDSTEQAAAYIRANVGPRFDQSRVEAFLRTAPEMVNFLERETEVAFDLPPGNPDYRPWLPGALTSGRSLVPKPFDGNRLGRSHGALRRPPRERALFLGMQINGTEVKHFLNATRSIRSAAIVAMRIARHLIHMARFGTDMHWVGGHALMGALLKTVLTDAIPIDHSMKARRLIKENGIVRGAVFEREGQEIVIHARKAVILATGGFPHDMARRGSAYPHRPKPSQHLSMAPMANTGDGISLGEEAGGFFTDDFADPAAWFPTSLVRYGDGTSGVYAHLLERGKPGVITVDTTGRRFMNEAQNYHDFVTAMIRNSTGRSEVTAYFVCDHTAFQSYGLGMAKPWPLPNGQYFKTGYIKRASTIAELAREIGVDAATMTATVNNFNINARSGMDPDFHRGQNAYDKGQGDARHRPNPCVRPLERPPFYAVRLFPGDLGTFAGLRTDEFSRVISRDSTPVAGLYAVGNDQANVFGGSYPGAGATLSPGMTFAYIAAKRIAADAERDPE